MTDAPVVHIGENSPHQVAYRLMHDIAKVEGKALGRPVGDGWEKPDRKWILQTYIECFNATR